VLRVPLRDRVVEVIGDYGVSVSRRYGMGRAVWSWGASC
jgi:hypothetical protein